MENTLTAGRPIEKVLPQKAEELPAFQSCHVNPGTIISELFHRHGFAGPGRAAASRGRARLPTEASGRDGRLTSPAASAQGSQSASRTEPFDKDQWHSANTHARNRVCFEALAMIDGDETEGQD